METRLTFHGDSNKTNGGYLTALTSGTQKSATPDSLQNLLLPRLAAGNHTTHTARTHTARTRTHRAQTNAHTHTHTHTHTARTRAHTRTSKRTHTHTHAHTSAHTHTHAHARAHTSVQSCQELKPLRAESS